ncbi:MAG: soluble lytic murein transglycosylase, partial [Bermanella sp.]
MAFQVRRRRGCRALYVLVLAVVSLSASALSHAAALDQQRALFRKAVVDARDGRLDEARDAMMALEDYALVPYLDLELFKAQIYDLSATTADSYLGRHQNTAVGLFMHRAWLSKLQQNREWEEFLAFTKGVAPRGMRCEYIAALRSTGRHAEADAETQSLWLTGNSLPDRCDTVLANWLPRLAPAD